MRRLILLVVLVVLGAAAACAGDDPQGQLCAEGGVDIADMTAWRVLADADDPLGPSAARCPPERHRTEVQGDARWHEVTTDGCSVAAVAQTTEVALCAGQAITLDVWVFPITGGDGPWTVTLGVGDQVVAASSVTQATEGTLVEVSGPVPRDVLAGERVWVRIANHGTNAWNLLSVRAGSD